MKKAKTICRKTLAFFLSVLMILSVLPMTVHAEENLGEISGISDIDIDVSVLSITQQAHPHRIWKRGKRVQVQMLSRRLNGSLPAII